MTQKIYINGRFLRQSLTGVQRFATEITAALGRAGVAPTLLVPPGPALDEIPGVTIRVVGRRQGQIWEQWELPRFARDGILLNLGNIAPLWLRRQIVVIHDCGVFATPEAYGWKFRAWYKFAQQLLVRTRTQIVTVSEFSKTEIVRYLGARPEDVTVISEGADHMHRIVADHSVLAAHTLTPGRYVLAVGSLAAHKNLAILSDLAVALEARGMVLAITGGLNRGVFQAADGAALPQPARYLGRVTDAALRSLYENAACLVFPSRYEGFGLPVIEAAACGCPVACSDIPVLREVCGAGAVYFDAADGGDVVRVVFGGDDERLFLNKRQANDCPQLPRLTWENAAYPLTSMVCNHFSFAECNAPGTVKMLLPRSL